MPSKRTNRFLLVLMLSLTGIKAAHPAEPELLAQWESPHRVNAVAISKDGSMVVAGGPHGRVSLWDVSAKELKRYALGTSDDTTSVDISPDGKLFAVTGIEGSMRVFEVASGRQVQEMGDHGSRLMRVRFSDDGTFVGTTCWDGILRWWLTRQAVKMGEIHSSMIGAGGLAFDPTNSEWMFPAEPRHDGQRLAPLSEAVVASQANKGRKTGAWKMPVEAWVVEASPDGKSFAVGDAGGSVRILDRASGKETRLWNLKGLPQGLGIVGLGYFEDGKKLAAMTMSGHGAVMDVSSGNIAVEMAFETNGFVSFDVVPSGKAVLGDWTKTIRVFNLTSPR